MKKIIKAAVALITVTSAFAFDWPISGTSAESISSDFGQLAGNCLNTSIIYREDSEVHSSDAGTVIATIDDHSDDFGWFESSLGSAAIVSHSDGLSTVYGNLNKDSMHEKLENKNSVKAGEVIATSGNSAWQEESNGLEFMVFDKKNLSAVNPKILMPRTAKEPHINSSNIFLLDKNGNYHNVKTEKRLASGTYLVYRARQENQTPYKTIVAVNGESSETIVYDTIKANNGKIGVMGNTLHTTEEMYPDKDKHFLAKIQLTKGQNTITVTLANNQDNATMMNFKLDIY